MPLSQSTSRKNASEFTRPLKVFLCYTGVGIVQRGVESFARECFDHLRGHPELDLKLYKGAGPNAPGEYRLWCVPRSNPLAAFVGRLLGRTGFVVEALTGFLALVRHIRAHQPDVIFFPSGKLNLLLCRWTRPLLRVPYRVLFSNGAPDVPPFPRADHIQQVNPILLAEAVRAGEPPDRQSMIPYGIHVSPGVPPARTPDVAAAMRRRLDLPTGRPIVLSVGWISSFHKRMDYVIEEIARIPEPERPYLVMLGHQDAASPPIIQSARKCLGEKNFAARSVPYAEVTDYYAVADIFTLASLGEAFGRVYLEALSAGLPCIVNDHPIHRFVLDREGIYVDMTQPGVLAEAIRAILRELPAASSPSAQAGRRESVRARFSWEALTPAYLEMFRQCARANPSRP